MRPIVLSTMHPILEITCPKFGVDTVVVRIGDNALIADQDIVFDLDRQRAIDHTLAAKQHIVPDFQSAFMALNH
jgi:hypothetical protein